MCHSYFSARYVVIEVATGLLFVLVYYSVADLLLIILNLLVVSLLVVIVVYDFRHTIIPDELVILLIPLSIGIMVWNPQAAQINLPEFADFVGAALASAFFLSLWWVSGGRWIGLGDAKLVFPLALIVGFGASLSLVVFSFWIGAALSLSLLAFQMLMRRGKQRLGFMTSSLTMKSEIPFAPFLVGSFILVHYAGVNIFDFTYVLFSVL